MYVCMYVVQYQHICTYHCEFSRTRLANVHTCISGLLGTWEGSEGCWGTDPTHLDNRTQQNSARVQVNSEMKSEQHMVKLNIFNQATTFKTSSLLR